MIFSILLSIYTLHKSKLYKIFIFFQILDSRVLDDFKFELSMVQESCSTVLRGKMWIFGGLESARGFKRQVSLVGDCNLRRQGTMPFDLYDGTANIFNESDGSESAILCFDLDSPTSCHS